jgi:uncharacterized membrane-anchored protein
MNLVVAALLAVAPAPPTLPSAFARVSWVPGPTTVDLGTQAVLRIPEAVSFAGPYDTKQIMQTMGNRVSGLELGLVSPKAAGDDWALVFEYSDVGHVQDDEKGRIDPRALLEALRQRAEQDRGRRKALGQPAMQVIGWYEAPHYDERTHQLIWAPRARTDSGRGVVNYNIRMLGREGFMAVTLIDTPGRLATSKTAALAVLEGFSFKPGRAYADYRPGDRLARQGLLALLTGGATGSLSTAALVGGAVLLVLIGAAAWWRSGRAQPTAEPAEARRGRRRSRRS